MEQGNKAERAIRPCGLNNKLKTSEIVFNTE